jgi:plastocyanin
MLRIVQSSDEGGMDMARTRIALVIGLAVAALAVAGCGGDDESASETTDTETTTETTTSSGDALSGSVGPGFEISLSGSDGAAFTTLAAGTYTIEVDDQSDIHNFHLTGEGVDVTTDVSGTGTESFDVDLSAGTYTFVCDPHASTMTGSFEVSG